MLLLNLSKYSASAHTGAAIPRYFREPSLASVGDDALIVPKRKNVRIFTRLKNVLALVSPEAMFLSRQGVKAPLADQGELSRASPASTRLRGSELPSFCVLSLTQFDNPSVKNQRFLPAVHCGMTATGSHGNFDSLCGAPPFTQGSHWVLPHQCVYRYFSEKPENCTTIIIPHSAFHNDMIFDSLAGISDYLRDSGHFCRLEIGLSGKFLSSRNASASW